MGLVGFFCYLARLIIEKGELTKPEEKKRVSGILRETFFRTRVRMAIIYQEQVFALPAAFGVAGKEE